MSASKPLEESPSEKYFRLWKRVREAIGMLKNEFKSTVEICGLPATELHSFGDLPARPLFRCHSGLGTDSIHRYSRS